MVDGPPQNLPNDWPGIEPGDLIAVDALFANGNGDACGLRVVLPTNDDPNRFRLEEMGYEFVEWPMALIDYWRTRRRREETGDGDNDNDNHNNLLFLRDLYQNVLDEILTEVNDFSFSEHILSGHATMEEYWANPLVREAMQQEHEEQVQMLPVAQQQQLIQRGRQIQQQESAAAAAAAGGTEWNIPLALCTWRRSIS